MENIRQYILSVIAAALICAVVNRLVTAKGAYASVVKLISGLFLTVTMIAPIINIQLVDLDAYFDGLTQEAEAIASSGQLAAEKEMAVLAKKKFEALILEKAASINVQITADVFLDEESLIPQKVELSGTVSPYSKGILTLYIQESLGIAEEDQVWI